jgi:hypothetical protein
MSEERRVDREGIHIERDLADQIAIEEELDANVEGEYRFPSPERRRLSGWVFVVAAIISAFAFEGGWLVGIGFLALAVWLFLSSWPLEVDEHRAMRNAAAVVDFPIGHASASIRFHGWRSRPRWSVLLYSAVDPPDRRALVLIDAITGDPIDLPYVEAIESV